MTLDWAVKKEVETARQPWREASMSSIGQRSRSASPSSWQSLYVFRLAFSASIDELLFVYDTGCGGDGVGSPAPYHAAIFFAAVTK
jgi:hypothetical protein